MSSEDVVMEPPQAVEAAPVETSEKAEPVVQAAPATQADDSKPAEAGAIVVDPPEGSINLKKVEDMTEEEVKAKIVQQVEFYFSESNLPFDKFLFLLSYKDNPEHWVPVGTIASFKRMRDYTAAKGTAYVAAALEDSSMLELSEDAQKVRRRVPLENVENRGGHDAFARSVYAKGFGEEVPGLQEELEEFFSQFGKWNLVRTRRDKETRKFKGSVFVEWADILTANKFVLLDPKPLYKGTELITMSKKAYCDMKIAEKGIDVTKEGFNRGASRRADSAVPGAAEGDGKKRDDFSGWKLINQQKRDEKAKRELERPVVYIDLEGEKVKVTKDGRVEAKELEGKYTKGALMAFEDPPAHVPWGDIKDPLKELFPRIYVQMQRGDRVGFVLVGPGSTERGAAQPPLQAITDEQVEQIKQRVKTVGEQAITWRRATDAEEKKYWLDRANFIAARSVKFPKSGDRNGGRQNGHGRGGGRGGRGGDSGRGRGRGGHAKSENATPARAEGVPVIKSTLASPSPVKKAEAAPVPEAKMEVDAGTKAAAVNGKRKREEGGDEDSGGKKAKVDETPA